MSALRTVASLAPEKLCPSWPADRIPWEDSRAIPRTKRRRPAQPRALAALELALNIRASGYNVYVSGSPDLGRTYMVTDFLEPLARKEATPPDILYVCDFDDEDHPKLLQLPAGQGRKLKNALADTLQKIHRAMPSAMDSPANRDKLKDRLEKFREERIELVKEMKAMAAERGFGLDTELQGALGIFPIKPDGSRISEEELLKLTPPERQALKLASDNLLMSMAHLLRKLDKLDGDRAKFEKSVMRDSAESVVDELLTPFAQKTCQLAGCSDEKNSLHVFFDALRADIMDHAAVFMSQGSPGSAEEEKACMARYEINLLVDNSQTVGAPVVVENHPTITNLLGCSEREAEMGTLITNFSLIKAGSLHRANGGYLVLHALDLLRYPSAWEGLMRTLRSGMVRIEDAELDAARVKSIEPEPMPLNVKVILVGEEEVFDLLLHYDERFAKLFKIKAQMSPETDRTAPQVRAWLAQAARIMDEAELLPFDRGALARLVDHGSWLCEDQRKLTLRFPLVREVLVESSAMATMQGKTMVDRAAVDAALRSQRDRTNLVEELYREEYERGIIKIQTDGQAVGYVNGLAISVSGDYEFGLPHRISCTVGVGQSGIIDLEREAEMSGPIHTKAMLILKSYLTSQFAHNKPLVLTGSLCFEQSYSGVEGDSASGAELAALLSAIAEVPLKLSLAFTGAVNQSGDIMAVGGVTSKIDGFFELCSRRGLTGEQGVIIPKDNVEHLMLDERIVNAVREGKFHIYPVSHISEALELLSGMPVGRRRKDGSFTKGSLFEKVDARLYELASLAEQNFKSRRKKK